MEIFEPDSHDSLIHYLQELSLEMNEYKKHHDKVPTKDYINLLDAFIQCVKNDREYIKFRDEMIDLRNETINDYKETVAKYNDVLGKFLKL